MTFNKQIFLPLTLVALSILAGIAVAQVGGGGVSSGGGGNTSETTGMLAAITLSSGCTTTPAETVNWTKTGSTVTLVFTNDLVCASNSAVKSFGIVLPAALRPVTGVTLNGMRCTDNATNVNCCVEALANGTLRLGINLSNVNNCAFDGWTSSGNFGTLYSQTTQQGGGNSFTYSVAN